jgi:hypothetical protein
VRRLEAVAIRADDPEVLQSVVVSVSIDVIKFDGDAAIGSAFGPAANLASWLLEPLAK